MSQTGERLRVLRDRAHLTQEQLGRRADVTTNTIARIEIGMVAKPQWRTIVRLANALGVSTHELAGDDVQPASTP